MTHLVTGGCGFIGSALVRRLVLREARRVVTLDALTYAATEEALAAVTPNPLHRLIVGDIAEPAVVRDALAAAKPTAVVHLAAESHVDRSIDGPGAFFRTNLLGTYVLLEETLRYWRSLDGTARGQFRFLHVSTDEVFGSLGLEGAFTEDTPYDPRSPYSASKAGADHLVRAWHHTYGLPTLVTNCSNNYGPFQFPEKLIPLTILRCLAGQPVPVYGTGDNVRDWLFVEDHVEALIRVLDRGAVGRSYNLGGRAERRNLDVVRSICDLVDAEFADASRAPSRDLISFVPDRPGHDFRYAMNIERVESELGWRPRESFEGGLSKTVRWFLANGEWCRRIAAHQYDGRRLGTTGAT